MSAYRPIATGPYVLAVSISAGGIPKRPQPEALARTAGLIGDGRNHAKHIKPERAISLWDHEILQDLTGEGFALTPGAAGENLTVVGLAVQQMAPGTLLAIGSEVVLQLEQPRKPCYVLDAIDPRLKEAVVGRCGYMASVVREGTIRPGMAVRVVTAETGLEASDGGMLFDEAGAPPGALACHMLAGPSIG
jgi:MOSC domain-containing protein YiiM